MGKEDFNPRPMGSIPTEEEPVVADVAVEPNDELQNPIATDAPEEITLAKLTGDKYKSIEEIEAIEKQKAELQAELDALKNAPKKTGNQFIDDLAEFIENGGDPFDYIKASKITVDGLSDLDIVKLNMQLSEPDLTVDEIDAYVRDLYKQYDDPEYYGVNESQAKVGLAKLKIDAKNAKKEIEEAKRKATYIAPKAKEPIAPEVDPKIAEEEARINREVTAYYKSFKGLEVNVDDVKVNIPIQNKDFVESCIENPNNIWKAVYGENGLDNEALIDLFNFASDRAKYRATIAKTSHSQGVEAHIKKINNPSNPKASTEPATRNTTQSPQDAFANGRIVQR